MIYAIKSISLDNQYLVISSILDLSLVVKLLVEDIIFKY